jgi:UDP-3-O-[3-hydroxymyristoyl] N-acetylglucosamine deacetylase
MACAPPLVPGIMKVMRRTLGRTALVRGIGLFTGKPAAATVRPAPPGTGIVFCRVDLPGRPRMAALAENISSRPVHAAFARMPARSTNLGPADGPPLVVTCEHVMSALAGMGITDAEIELEGAEVPIGDGSAREFVEAIVGAGVAEVGGQIEPVRLREPVRIEDGGGGMIEATPAAACEFAYELDYGPASPIRRQRAEWRGCAEEYRSEIAPARTFCLEEEARAMRAMGLFSQFSPRDLLVFGAAGPIDNTLRSENEPSRHKLQDLIGDLALVGRPIAARIRGVRSGHALNQRLATVLRQA